jgi:chromosomal replication initiation ATPase DnaA
MIQVPTISIPEAQNLAAGVYNVPPELLRSKSRIAHVAEPRQLAVFFALNAGHTQRHIQEHFAYKDHAAVCHARTAVQNRLDTMPPLKARVEEILVKISRQEKAA